MRRRDRFSLRRLSLRARIARSAAVGFGKKGRYLQPLYTNHAVRGGRYLATSIIAAPTRWCHRHQQDCQRRPEQRNLRVLHRRGARLSPRGGRHGFVPHVHVTVDRRRGLQPGGHRSRLSRGAQQRQAQRCSLSRRRQQRLLPAARRSRGDGDDCPRWRRTVCFAICRRRFPN